MFHIFNGIGVILAYLSVTLFCTYLFVICKKAKVKNFPPGPFGWPIVGNYLEYASNTHVKLAKSKQKYGDIFSGRVGSMNLIVLSSAKAIKKAYNKSDFLGKTPFYGCDSFKNSSVFFSNDLEVWKEQRGFVVRTIQDLGLGKVTIENEIQDEIQRLFRFLEEKQKENVPIDLGRLLVQSTANNILAMVLGERFCYDGQVLTDLIKSIKEYLTNMTFSGMYMTFPWIRYLTPILKLLRLDYFESTGYENTKVNLKKILEVHKKTFKPEDIRDFFDSYLQVIYNEEGSSNFSEDILIATTIDFVGAGAETTAHAILWCMYMIAAYPDVKRKLLEEIEDVVGLTRTPSMSDQKLMPYTQAFLLEVLRWASVVPIAPLRYTVNDTTLCGYDIPKDTAVLANLWATQHDPEVWDEPQSINPERFLEDDGKTLKKLPSYPFSIGKRKCPGEAMALMELFLYVVSILQCFDINFLPGEKPTFESEILVTSRPRQFPICLQSRTNGTSLYFF